MISPNSPSGTQMPIDPGDQIRQQLSVAERIATLSESIQQYTEFDRVAETYALGREHAGQIATNELEQQTVGDRVVNRQRRDSEMASGQMLGEATRQMAGLTEDLVIKPVVSEIADTYGLKTQARSDSEQLAQKLAKKRIKKEAEPLLADYKQSAAKGLQDSYEDKVAESLPRTPDENDDAAIRQLGIEDYDKHLHARLNTLEAALSGVTSKAAGRAVLGRLIPGSKAQATDAKSAVASAAYGLLEDMHRFSHSTQVSVEVQGAIRTYVAENDLKPLEYADFVRLGREALQEVSHWFTPQEAQSFVRRRLEKDVIPKMQKEGMFNVTAAPPRADPLNINFDELFRDAFKTAQDAHETVNGGREYARDQQQHTARGPRGNYEPRSDYRRVQDPAERKIDTEIEQMRNRGMDDGSIKRALLKEHRDPSGRGDDSMAKIISDRFRPKNSDFKL